MLPMMLPVTRLPVTEGNVTELSVTSNASVTRKAAPLLDVTVLLDLGEATEVMMDSIIDATYRDWVTVR